MSALQPVAARLQTWRIRRGMSVSDLAREAGISKSTLSELERHNGNPSLDTLWALAGALNIPLGFLFIDNDTDKTLRVVLEDEAAIVTPDQPDYVARLMACWDVNGEVEIYVVTMAEGTRRDSGSHGFGVVEHAISIEGHVNIGLSNESTELRPGDFITFPADQPHHYEAIGGPARLLSIHQYPRGRPERAPTPDTLV
jgi:transcriptional regulator with XRE-family HTH domain